MSGSGFQGRVAVERGGSPPPRILMAGARALYLGPSFDLAPHRNAVATVALALEDAFAYRRLDCDEEQPCCRIVLIEPGTMHHLKAFGAMAFLYLDALGDSYARLRRAVLSPPKSSEWMQHASTKPRGTIDALCAALGIGRRPDPDRRIAQVVRGLDEVPEEFASVEMAAARAGLSKSRFQHLFRDVMGLPFRRYRLWRRMAVVARGVAAGHSLTAAAHEAGFASSAHLSSSFRAMFGMTPSALIRAGADFVIAS